MPGDVVLVSRNQTESPVLITAMDVPLAPPDGELNDNDLRPVEVRAARAAVQAGVASASIERLPFDLSALESDGILVNVDARNFGLLDRRLDWQALGITLPRGTDLARQGQDQGPAP